MDLRDKLSSLSVSPPRILKIVIGLSVVLLLMWLFTLSQIDHTGENTGGREVFQQEQAADSLSADSAASEAGDADRYGGSSDMFSNGLITFFVLVIILAAIWFWIDRSEGAVPPAKGREIDSHTLGEGGQLKIIRMNSEVWVLGVTSASVNLLHRYAEDEWKETKDAYQTADTGTYTFGSLFRSKL
ncbi:Flagellar biogenesis protein FliO [Fodinibius roseus]|uniref:Flagellar biogenesis protein FliO n=2 Tax=Fodinibius roseus TaxID=1194090 RepID=A0A1M5HEY2_9BACT|nr:Flagellar biogenesis protein FliO [Fodinibius roseus]